MAAFTPANSAVWFEIPVTDIDKARRFYGSVLGGELTLDNDGPNPMAMFPAEAKGVSGHLYPGSPAQRGAGATIHLAVADLAAGLDRVKANGGEVVSEIISIPAGRFAYCLDPDGNSFGLFC